MATSVGGLIAARARPRPLFKAAEVAEKYWRLAGGYAHDAGDEPLVARVIQNEG